MPIKLKSSGGGSITLDVPNTGTDYTLSAPARTGNIITSADANTINSSMLALNSVTAAQIAASSITTDKMGYSGAVLQVVTALDNSWTTQSVGSGSTTNWLSASIARTKSNSKILVMFYGQFSQSTAIDSCLRLYSSLDGRVTAAEGVPGGSRMAGIYSSGTDYAQQSAYAMVNGTFQYLYTPGTNTTSSITLTVQYYSEGGTTVAFNGDSWRGADQQAHGSIAHLTLLEIAA